MLVEFIDNEEDLVLVSMDDGLHEFRCIDSVIKDVNLTKRQREYYETFQQCEYNQTLTANELDISTRSSKKMISRIRQRVNDYLDELHFSFINELSKTLSISELKEIYESGDYSVNDIAVMFDIKSNQAKTILDGTISPTNNVFANRYDYDDIKNSFESKGYTLVSKEYINAQSKLEYICPEGHHGEITHIMWQRKEIACNECSSHQGGNYTKTRAEKHKDEWLKTPSSVYIARLYDDKENFYKIGMSVNIEKRFHSFPYNVEKIKIIDTNLYDGCYLETELQDLHTSLKYVPKKEFSGYKECFSDIIIN